MLKKYQGTPGILVFVENSTGGRFTFQALLAPRKAKRKHKSIGLQRDRRRRGRKGRRGKKRRGGGRRRSVIGRVCGGAYCFSPVRGFLEAVSSPVVSGVLRFS